MTEYTVKCSLARLGAAPEIRRQIDLQVERYHALALRGFHVASHTALRMLREGSTPAVTDQNWWNRCMNSCGSFRASKRNICTKDAEIEHSIQELFGEVEPITSNNSWPFVNELAKQTITMVQNMLAANFHKQLEKAFRREILIWKQNTQQVLAKELQWKLIQHAVRLTSGHQSLPPIPPDAPQALVEILTALAADWKGRFTATVPICPTAEFIYNQKPLSTSRQFRESAALYLGGILQWMYVLQEHRLDCLRRLEQILPAEEGRTARSVLGPAAKPLALLPMVSFRTPQMAISQDNGLESLFRGAKLPAVKDFYEVFPNLRKLDRGGTCHYIRTDGVTVSLTMKRHTLGSEERPRKRRKVAASAPRGTDRGTEPALPLVGQRLVGIDPGRRDMVAVVSNDGDAFTVSTKSFRADSGSARAARRTLHHLERTPLGDGSNLAERLQTLPCRRDIGEWHAYLASALPLLDTILHAYQSKCLRRWRFYSFQQRDRALDSLCKRITANQDDVLVAFGDASSCHTGFGYAPAPQGRLRKRLVLIHHAKVTLIDEYKTSQLCCKCHTPLHTPTMRHSPGKVENSKILLRKLACKHFHCGANGSFTERPHGLRSCGQCRNEKGAPLFCHRDLNSAQNMLDLYVSLAREYGRPLSFRR